MIFILHIEQPNENLLCPRSHDLEFTDDLSIRNPGVDSQEGK